MKTPIIDLGWGIDAIARRLGGSLVGDEGVTITSVTIDSRDVPRGSLFVAIVGDNFDGHDFASAALEAGAAAVVVERGRGVDAVPRVEVPATLDALKQLGVERRNELGMPVVAITGSTGKTSTKDLIAAGIPGSWSSPRSFNNEIGVPLTVVSTRSD